MAEKNADYRGDNIQVIKCSSEKGNQLQVFIYDDQQKPKKAGYIQIHIGFQPENALKKTACPKWQQKRANQIGC